MQTVALIAVGVLAALLALLFARRVQEIRRVREVGDRLEAAVQSGDLAPELQSEAGEGPAAALARGADELLARLRDERAGNSAREAVLQRVASAMHEGLAVERDGIRLANARFADLCGAVSTTALIARPLGELVHPDYRSLVEQHLDRHRSGQPAPARLEIELPAGGGATRVELGVERVVYDGGPALLVSLVEMRPARPREPRPGMHAAARGALDALGEGVITTDLEGRITYVNRAGEELIGRAAREALGLTLLEVIELVEEGERKALGDPVRQCLASGSRVQIGRRGMVVSGDGEGERSIELNISPLRDAAGDLSGTVIALRDVSDLRGLTRQMSYQASHDALTGLETLDDLHPVSQTPSGLNPARFEIAVAPVHKNGLLEP